MGVALAGAIGYALNIIDRVDGLLFDAQVHVVRALRDPQGALPAGPQVVIVGIDEASLNAQGLPMAMLHAPLGRALEAIAAAGPLAIGMDVALPERSFEHLVPGLDRELMRGLLAARAAAGINLVLDVDADGHPRIPPAPLLAAAGGGQAFGLALFPIDCDGVVRRFDPDPEAASARYGTACTDPEYRPLFSLRLHERRPQEARLPSSDRVRLAVPTFAAGVARRFGREGALAEAGWIDFTRGAAFSYVPLGEVLARSRRDDARGLQELFGGQIVLLGSVLPYLDRLQLPAALSAWEFPGTAQPGVILTAQVLRNAAGAGLLRPAPLLAQLALLAAMASIGLVAGAWLRWWALAGSWACAFATASLVHALGWVLAPGQAMLAGAIAVVARGALDLAAAHRERERLRRRLGGYLSPHLLQALLRGPTDTRGTRCAIALLFADLRGFTTWSETADPEIVRDTLNRYYGRITPLLHAQGGTIDNFRGDGILVLFGAPQAQAQPCDRAFAAACQLLDAVAQMNASELTGRGVPALEVSIGLSFGEVLVGDLGSDERRDYTALGDAVNVAARLQELAKTQDATVLMTRAFARRLSAAPSDLRDLGEQPLRGHSPVAVCGWRPPLPPS